MIEKIESPAPSIDAAVPGSFSDSFLSCPDGSAALDYAIGSFALLSEELILIILITRISDQFLVAVPHGA